jgi:hypothetical protein
MRTRGYAALVALLMVVLMPGQASAADRSFEAETLGEFAWHWQTDTEASGGKALRMASRTWVTKDVTTAAPSYWISVRAKGKRCVSDPQMTVRVDGQELITGRTVSADGWKLYEAELPSLKRGTYPVVIQFTNPGKELIGTPLECERDLYVDKVTIHSPFADDSFRNQPLADSAPLDPNSTSIVADLTKQKEVGYGTYTLTNQYSVPVYIVPADQPKVDVWSPHWDVQQQVTQAPIPPNARPADPKADNLVDDDSDGTTDEPDEAGDMNLLVYQPATDTIWEFWQLRRRTPQPSPPSWETEWGGRMDNVSQSPGYFTEHNPPYYSFGASASRISMLAGLQRIAELQRGEIDHAVDMCLPNIKKNFWVWPAQFTDRPGGELADPATAGNPIPEGTRFRLPTSLNVDSLGLPPYTRTLAKAIQRYGLVVRDKGANACFYAEDPKPSNSDPYAAIFGGLYPNNDDLFADFPWDQLQVVAVPPGSDTGPFPFVP